MNLLPFQKCKTLFVLLCLCSALLANESTLDELTPHEKSWLQQNPSISFTGDPDWLPFEAFDEEKNYIGIIADYLKRIEKNLAISIQPVPVESWDETLEISKNAGVDIISGDIDDAVIVQNYKPIEPYLKTPIVIVMKETDTFITRLEEIQKKKIAIIKGYGYTHELMQTYTNMSFHEVDNIDMGFESILDNTYDALLLSLPSAIYNLRIRSIHALKIVGKTTVMMKPTLFVHRDKPELHSILSKAMKNISHLENENILNKWQKIDFAEKTDYVLIYKIALTLSFFILVSLFWNRKLGREIEQRKLLESKLLKRRKELEGLKKQLEYDNIILNSIMSSTKDIVFYKDKNLNYLGANKAFFDFVGKTRPEILGHSDEELFSKNIYELFASKDARILKEQTTHTSTESFYTEDGEEISLLIQKVPFTYANKDIGILGIARDISEIQKAKNDAQLASKSKSEFLANMSHEIRTPMNAIIGFTELLNTKITDPKLKSYTQTIKSASSSLLTLINDILDLSKIEAGKLEIQKTPTNLFSLSNELSAIFNIEMESKGLDLIIDIDKDIPHGLLIDEIRLRQVLLNLLGNAVKFTQEGYIKVSIASFNVQDHLSKLDIEISVEDTGIGISKEEHEKIFREFEQTDGQDNKRFAGTGLGLSISKRLCEMMDGKIGVESEIHKGSIFSVHLYNIDISSIAVNDTATHTQVKNTHFKRAKVLIVDDIKHNRDLIIENFKDTEIEILSAEDGLEAIKAADKYKPDLILMDIRMPNMNGYEATSAIKKIHSMPIIALTASVMQEETDKLEESDFDGFLRKPLFREDLFAELSKFLAYEEQEVAQSEMPEIVPELSKKTISNLDTILQIIDQEIQPIHIQLEKTNSISEAQNLIEKVDALANKYDIGILKNYASKLHASVETFDIEMMEVLIKEFTPTVQKLLE